MNDDYKMARKLLVAGILMRKHRVNVFGAPDDWAPAQKAQKSQNTENINAVNTVDERITSQISNTSTHSTNRLLRQVLDAHGIINPMEQVEKGTIQHAINAFRCIKD